MRSMSQIFNAVMDGEISTPEQARALVDEECVEWAKALGISEPDARAQLLDNFAEVANRLFPASSAAYLIELFSTNPPKENDGDTNNERTI